MYEYDNATPIRIIFISPSKFQPTETEACYGIMYGLQADCSVGDNILNCNTVSHDDVDFVSNAYIL